MPLHGIWEFPRLLCGRDAGCFWRQGPGELFRAGGLRVLHADQKDALEMYGPGEVVMPGYGMLR